MADTITPPYYPIIFVRGYAGSQNVIEDATADPYMGLNVGATKIRQLWTGDVAKYIFESPLIRLMKDHGYSDVYEGGAMFPPGKPVPPKSVVIYRYYDVASKSLGQGVDKEIEEYAAGLANLVLEVRDRVCQDDNAARNEFRVYLVAHSMGGLICRSFLQNTDLQPAGATTKPQLAEARAMVDKVFTYATPHNGIDLKLIGNVPGFLSANNVDNFNRARMKQYLGLKPEAERVDSLDGKFDPDRFFCLVGTNDRDYEVAMGMSRRVVGPMSDGLVRIDNATVHGPPDAAGKKRHAPRAFVHRSHSGHYGIVNSEEGYQNLTRFLFGDVRIDGELVIKELTLPPTLEQRRKKAKDTGKDARIRASYHFEAIVRVRGALWDLHRRIASEGSAAFAMYDQLMHPAAGVEARKPHLFSVFLSKQARVNARRASLGFSVDLSVLVPQYEVDGLLMFDDHYEGGHLFRDKINFEAIPPADAKAGWTVKYGYDSRTPNATRETAQGVVSGGQTVFEIPVVQRTDPGIDAVLRLTARAWK